MSDETTIQVEVAVPATDPPSDSPPISEAATSPGETLPMIADSGVVPSLMDMAQTLGRMEERMSQLESRVMTAEVDASLALDNSRTIIETEPEPVIETVTELEPLPPAEPESAAVDGQESEMPKSPANRSWMARIFL